VAPSRLSGLPEFPRCEAGRDTLGPAPQPTPTQINFMEDYRRVDGIMVAFTIRTRLAAVTQVFAYDVVCFNVPIDDAVFRIPR
jgi:hypothetical protein